MPDCAVLSRRAFVAGTLAASAALALPACQSLPPFSLEEAVRRLLYRSTERAFARLTAQDGYWDGAVAQIGLSRLLGTRGNVLADILTSPLFRSRLEGAFADIAFEASDRAAPIVTDTVRVIGLANARALIDGGPMAATAFLRGNMGTRLVDALVPEVGDAIRVAQDPLVAQLLAGLTGADVGGLARSFSSQVEEIIWREIGNEEAAIRANPGATGDPLLIGVLTAAGA